MFKIKSHKLFKDDKAVNFVPTSNKSGVIKPLYIVLHDTASPLSPQGDIDWLSGKSGNRNSSAHFVVDRNGNITQLANCNIKTWHAGQSKWNGKLNCNDFTIGIEIDNPGQMVKVKDDVYRSYYGNIIDDEKVDFAYAETSYHGKGYWAFYSPMQIDAVIGMCQAIVEYYNCSEIITHYLISPGRKVDVNPLFPLEQVRNRVFGHKEPPSVLETISFAADATITIDDLNIRGMAAMGANVVGTLNKGDRVDIQGIEGNWLKIITKENKGGYIYKTFVKLD